MNSLDKYKLSYEYDQSYSEIRKAFALIRKKHRQQLAEIKKKAKAKIPPKELSKQYNMTVQKIVAIVRKA